MRARAGQADNRARPYKSRARHAYAHERAGENMGKGDLVSIVLLWRQPAAVNCNLSTCMQYLQQIGTGHTNVV
jgi:hypothetical protein